MIITAQIEDANILIEDHGILTLQLFIKTSEGWSTALGGMYLDYMSEDGKRHSYPHTSELIRSILEVLDVHKWSEVKGKYIRVETTECASITKMGHIVENKWFDFKEFYNSKKEG